MSRKCFHGGSSIEALGDDFSRLDNIKNTIRADVTDAWYDPSPKILKTISENLAWSFRNSPPTLSPGLIQTISKVRNLPEENIIIGGGSSDLIYLFFPIMFPKGGEVLIIDPMYGEYSHIIESVLGGKLVRVSQSKKDNFKVNTNKIVDKITSNTNMIILVNPNNPTGSYIEKQEIISLLEKIPKEVILFIDEAYIEYVGKENSVETLVTKYSNLVVLKSMSKIYALSGVRVGYLAATNSTIEKLSLLSAPWSISLQGQISGIFALKNEEYYLKKIEETKLLRKKMIQEIANIPGVKPYPSVGNFVLIELIDTTKGAEEIRAELASQKVYIRNPNSQSSQFKDSFVRIAVRSEDENKKIITALKASLS